MSLEEIWDNAIKQTEIVCLPIKRLQPFEVTSFNYIFLAPSVVNQGDTVVRKGRLEIARPTLLLPKNHPTFEGFDSETGSGLTDDQLGSFFYLRGITFPSLQYRNDAYEVDLFEGSVAKAEKKHVDQLRMSENISTGIVIGVDDSWQFSVILLACHVIEAHVDADLKAILSRIKKKY